MEQWPRKLSLASTAIESLNKVSTIMLSSAKNFHKNQEMIYTGSSKSSTSMTHESSDNESSAWMNGWCACVLMYAHVLCARYNLTLSTYACVLNVQESL